MIVARSLLVLALLGCASASAPAPEPTTAATARRRRRRRRPAVPSTAQCDALRAESRATVARALGARPATAWPALAALDWCAPTPGGGAWALHVDALAVERDPDTRREVLAGTFSLVHASAEGARASVRPWSEGITGPEGNLVCAPGDECVTVEAPSLFDHDGDGEPEVFVRVATVRERGAGSFHGRVWTFRDGAVDVYPPSRPWMVAAVRDVDNDGRPDLLTHGHYLAEAPGPCGRAPVLATGPLLAVHSLPDGRFSLDDAAARRADRVACPAATASAEAVVVTTPDGRVDPAATFVRAVCARLWGASAAAVTRRLQASAEAVRAGGARCATRPRSSNLDVLVEWVQQMPPVDLR
ncbi:MAG: VCBS repeat-containing protein [Myxococcales bacterium]|nr:VCBS repeat-containing protein [Myxococcales bacterium]